MKIAIDGRMMLAGQGTYARHLIDELQQIDEENEYFVLLRRSDFERVELVKPNFHKRLADFGQYSFSEQILLPFLLYRLKVDVTHFVSYNLPLAYLKPYVVTVHDLTLLDFRMRRPGLRGSLYVFKYWAGRLALRWVVRQSKRILVPTKYVEQQVVGRYGVSPTKVTVTYEAAETNERVPVVRPSISVDGQFILSVGSPYPHKNYERLIRAFALVRQKRAGIKLVIVGGTAANQLFLDGLKALVDEMGLKEAVIFAGYLSNAEVRWLYSKAVLYVFASLSEGFGLPGLEAMAAGLPVAASRATSLPEVYGGAAEYFDPTNVKDMAECISGLLSSPERAEKLRQAGYKQIKRYSWRKMAQETLAAYRSV